MKDFKIDDSSFQLAATHVYVGVDRLPKDPETNEGTIKVSKFPFFHSSLDSSNKDFFHIEGIHSSEDKGYDPNPWIYFIAHASDCSDDNGSTSNKSDPDPYSSAPITIAPTNSRPDCRSTPAPSPVVGVDVNNTDHDESNTTVKAEDLDNNNYGNRGLLEEIKDEKDTKDDPDVTAGSSLRRGKTQETT